MRPPLSRRKLPRRRVSIPAKLGSRPRSPFLLQTQVLMVAFLHCRVAEKEAEAEPEGDVDMGGLFGDDDY